MEHMAGTSPRISDDQIKREQEFLATIGNIGKRSITVQEDIDNDDAREP